VSAPAREGEANTLPGGRTVLVLAYHFPPVGGSGVQRNVKFVRYLESHGYRSVVMTGSGETTSFWAPNDETLLREVPPSAEIHRIGGREPFADRPWRNRLDRIVARPEPFARWWNSRILEHGARLGSGADVIYASLTPYETALAASGLARRLNRPWVADLQDPWALDEIWFYPTGLHRRIDLRRMRSALSTAAAVVVNSDEAEKRFRAAMPELRARLVTIPNGFDAEDFRGQPEDRTDGRFRIVHAGYLYTAIGRRHRRVGRIRRALGGSPTTVDVLPRSLVFLLEALERLIDHRPELAEEIEVHLAGVLSDADEEVVRGSDLIHKHGYLLHAETVALVRSADLLFLPLHDVPRGSRVGIVPGKTYEYLASGRPILAAVPDGDARDLLARAGTACLCRPRDVTAMVSCVKSQLDRWRRGTPADPPKSDVIARFERRRLAADLAAVFDRVVESPSELHGEKPEFLAHSGEAT
jgi:glycosyltransferase involved in cell wall biosynthesis